MSPLPTPDRASLPPPQTHMTQLPHRVPAKKGAITGAEVKSWGCTQSFPLCPGPFTRLETKHLGCASGPSKAEPLWECRQALLLRDWREPMSTNGYGTSERIALQEDAQVFWSVS